MAVERIQYPEDLYATQEEGQSVTPLPIPHREQQTNKKSSVATKPSVPQPTTKITLPDADLPLFTAKAPEAILTASALLERCKQYLASPDVEKIREAYRYADAAHLGQFRKSGEPYITHPIAVASILAQWKMDAATIQAGLMHDVLEDTPTSKQEMAEKFGIEVAELVDGVSKLDKLRFSSAQAAQAESFRKMLLAMSRDVRVILVKLADRLHNMRTLGVMRPEKCARIAKETLDIYVPIAHRLGLNIVFRELQELSFANRYPLRYKVLYENVLLLRNNRRAVLERILEETREFLPKHHIRARILGRDKTIYGIYNKMRESHQSFSDALDIYGFRVIVRTVEDCYLALGALHVLYKPVHRRFKDFIAIPKLNGYQSLHTTVIGPYGTPIEYQIRTEEMHQVSEYGILTQWMNKNDIDSSDMQSRTAAWLQNLMEIQRTSADSSEFLENIKVDLFPNRVYTFTPKGRIISLPKGGTPVDFAYQIHTDVGNQTKGCRINGEPKPLSTELHNGDQVEIITDPASHPHPEWLEFVHSGRARAEIRQYLRNCRFEDSVRLGRLALETIAQDNHLDLSTIPTEIWHRLQKELDVDSLSSLYASVGLGKDLPAAVVHRLIRLLHAQQGEGHYERALPDIIIRGNEGVAVSLSQCCHPIPGDKIVGFNRSGHGLIIHRADCPHVVRNIKTDPERWMEEVQWAPEQKNASFAVPLEIHVRDPNSSLALIVASVAEANSSITGVMIDEDGEDKFVRITVQVRDRGHLMHVMRTIKQTANVEQVKRVFEAGLPSARRRQGKKIAN